MPRDEESAKLLAEMRKLERQAKQLLYKMDRIESAWNTAKATLKKHGKDVPHLLGDVLHGWKRKASY